MKWRVQLGELVMICCVHANLTIDKQQQQQKRMTIKKLKRSPWLINKGNVEKEKGQLRDFMWAYPTHLALLISQ